MMIRSASAASPTVMKACLALLVIVATITSLSCIHGASASTKALKYTQVNNIIVIMLENWSYDGLFGTYVSSQFYYYILIDEFIITAMMLIFAT